MRGRLDLARRVLRQLPRLASLRPDSRQTVTDLLEERAGNGPDRPLLWVGESGAPRPTTYAELNAAANRVAWWGLHRGLRRGDVVALMMENRPEYVATWAGLAKLGVVTALINTHLTGPPLAHALEAAGARRIVCGTECLDRYDAGARELEQPPELWLAHEATGAAVPTAVPPDAHDLDAELAERSAENPDPSLRESLRAGDVLFYIYTSGTTGLPKAARFSHLRFLGAGLVSALALRMDPEDVHYCALPLYHSAGGVMMVGATLFAGASLALRRRFSARAFWDDCRRFGATRFQYIGEFCRYLLNQPPRPDDRDHGVRIAMGNGLRPDVWVPFQERFGLEQIVEFYAATEGNVALINLENRPGSVGRVPFGWLGRRLSPAKLIRFDVEREEPVRDARGFCMECGPDEVGELVGRVTEKAALRFEGYTSRQATERKLLHDVFEPGDCWFRSGDLLKRDAGGWYSFVDRIGDTFRWKGENVSTQEVAEILGAFPDLEMVNVYGVRVEGMDGRAGMAALLLKGGPGRFDPEAFYAFVDERLPRYAAPVFLRLVGEAEVTGTLKLRKVRLQDEGFDLARVKDPLWLRDDEAGRYLPLTPSLHQELLSGAVRV